LLVGTSGSGKSSLINKLAGATLAPVGDSGDSCTKENISYELYLKNELTKRRMKLRIFDTQGFNDTETSFKCGNGNLASTIKF